MGNSSNGKQGGTELANGHLEWERIDLGHIIIVLVFIILFEKKLWELAYFKYELIFLHNKKYSYLK